MCFFRASVFVQVCFKVLVGFSGLRALNKVISVRYGIGEPQLGAVTGLGLLLGKWGHDVGVAQGSHICSHSLALEILSPKPLRL